MSAPVASLLAPVLIGPFVALGAMRQPSRYSIEAEKTSGR
jgi:hypothetical protein